MLLLLSEMLVFSYILIFCAYVLLFVFAFWKKAGLCNELRRILQQCLVVDYIRGSPWGRKRQK